MLPSKTTMKVLVVNFAMMLRRADGFASCPPLVGCVDGSTRLGGPRVSGGTALRLAPEDVSATAAAEFKSRRMSMIPWDDLWPIPWTEVEEEQRAEFILSRCAAPKPPSIVAAGYFKRRSLNQRFVTHASRDVPNTYMVIVGPSGGGKTIAVNYFLTGRDKVVYLRLSAKLPTINAALKEELGIDQSYAITSENILGRLSELSSDEKPVLVVEVDSEEEKGGLEKGAVKKQCEELKVLTVDFKLTHAFIVLSDANALKLKQDRNRQSFVWVGDFTAGEMGTFLDQRGVLPTTDEEAGDGLNSKMRRRIMGEIGANPRMLVHLYFAATDAVAALSNAGGALSPEVRRATEYGAIEAFIEKCNWEAKGKVHLLLSHLTYKDTARRLMRLLLSGDFPRGVSEYDGDFCAVDLGEAVGDYRRALCFNSETDLCQWYSPANERAARECFEKEVESTWSLLSSVRGTELSLSINRNPRKQEQRKRLEEEEPECLEEGEEKEEEGDEKRKRLKRRWLGLGRFFI